jgi:hypothetical protein
VSGARRGRSGGVEAGAYHEDQASRAVGQAVGGGGAEGVRQQGSGSIRARVRGVQIATKPVSCAAMLQGDPLAPDSDALSRGRVAVAWLVGVVVAVASWYAIISTLPRPWSGHNLLNYELAGMIGSLAGMSVVAVVSPKWKRRMGLMAITWATTLAFLVPILEFAEKDMMHRRQFSRWVPILAGSGCFLWTAAYVAERITKRRIALFTALIAGVSLCAVTLQNGKYMHDSLAGDRVRAWNVYHYYVGSKYFNELSYFGLYAATLTADDNFQAEKKKAKGKRAKRLKRVRDFKQLKKARDMRDYLVKPRKKIVDSFSDYEMEPARLEQLGRDTRFLRTFMGIRPPGWTNTLQDLGYNPGPAWTIVGVPLTNLVPPKWPYFHLISNSDVPLFLLTFLLLWWGFGLRVASAMALWCCTIQFNESRFAGGFLQYDWFASVLMSAAFYRRGWYRAAGVALTWGAMTRVFPGFLILPFVIWAARDAFGGLRGGDGGLLRSAWFGIKHRHRAFLLSFTLACGVLFVGSHFTGQGLSTWPEWVEKIGRHSETHAVTSNQRVGVGRLAIHKPKKGQPWGELRGDRNDRLDEARPKKRKLQLFGLLLLIPALVRRRDMDGFVLAMFSVFCAVVLSRYYASTWSIFFLLGAAGMPLKGSADPDEQAMAGTGPHRGVMGFAGWLGGAGLLFMAATYYVPGGTTASYFYVNWIFFSLCVALCVGYLVGDVRHWLGGRQAAAAGSTFGGASADLEGFAGADPLVPSDADDAADSEGVNDLVAADAAGESDAASEDESTSEHDSALQHDSAGENELDEPSAPEEPNNGSEAGSAPAEMSTLASVDEGERSGPRKTPRGLSIPMTAPDPVSSPASGEAIEPQESGAAGEDESPADDA